MIITLFDFKVFLSSSLTKHIPNTTIKFIIHESHILTHVEVAFLMLLARMLEESNKEARNTDI